MPYTIEVLTNMPVIYAKYNGTLTQEELVSSMIRANDYAEKADNHKIFHIIDVSNAVTDFNVIMGVFKEMATLAPQWNESDIDYQAMFIGTNQMAKLSAQMMALPQFGGGQVPLFKTFGDAISYIHKVITQSKASDL